MIAPSIFPSLDASLAAPGHTAVGPAQPPAAEDASASTESPFADMLVAALGVLPPPLTPLPLPDATKSTLPDTLCAAMPGGDPRALQRGGVRSELVDAVAVAPGRPSDSSSPSQGAGLPDAASASPESTPAVAAGVTPATLQTVADTPATPGRASAPEPGPAVPLGAQRGLERHELYPGPGGSVRAVSGALTSPAESAFPAQSSFPEQIIPAEDKEQQADRIDPARHASWAELSPSTQALAQRDNVDAPRERDLQPGLDPVDQVKEAVLSQRDELARHGRAEIHLQLDPPDLGRVRVHLSGDGDQVSARLVAHEKGTVALLESQAGNMRQRLEEVGITLAKFEVAWQGTGQSDRWQEQNAPQPWVSAPGQRGLAPPRRAPAASAARGRIDLLA